MADNFLENQYDAWAHRQKVTVRRSALSLDTLLHDNRSHRGYDNSVVVSEDQLHDIVRVCTLLPSGHNAQVLRYRCVTAEEAGKVLPHIRLGGAIPELHLPLPGTEPRAFVVACTTVPMTPTVWMDLGIACEAMGLKAVEKGLNALIIRAFDAAAVKEALALPLEPVAVLAVGKGGERIFLKPTPAGESLKYYRKDGVHFVPKLPLEDILI